MKIRAEGVRTLSASHFNAPPKLEIMGLPALNAREESAHGATDLQDRARGPHMRSAALTAMCSHGRARGGDTCLPASSFPLLERT